MQASWNQWTGSTGSYAPNYPGAFPTVPPVSATNPFQVSTAGSVTTPTVGSQFSALYGQQQTQTTQQQWQQWEQWQQQYAQWHQQYGDKFQGSVPTPGTVTSSVASTFPSVPPLPSNAPTVQPPPPDSVPPPSDKNDENNKRPHDGSGNEESKKQKTGKSKSETLESLIESEKTFDQQFKSWELSFMQWKEQNANHPDKAQYKEYEAKWESFRGQLLQKRETLRKKRETKETEVAAAAAAAKEAALATTNISNVQSGYSTTTANQTNPYMTPNMMYPMSGMFTSQDVSQIVPSPTAPNYMSNFSMYSMPPPPSLPTMPVMPQSGGLTDSLPNKLSDPSKPTQSLEFLSATAAAGSKSIPGLDLASDKSANPAFMSNIPSNSSLFSYSQDVSKPLRTSDDKPFNFPRPPQMNYEDDKAQNPYPYQRGRSRFDDEPYNRFGKSDFPLRFDKPGPNTDPNDRFSCQNLRPSNSYDNDFKYRSGGLDSSARNDGFRNEDRNNFRSEDRGPFRNDERPSFRNDGFRNDDRSKFRNEERGGFRIDDRSNFRHDDRGTFRNDDRGSFRNDDRGNFDRNNFRSDDRSAFPRNDDRSKFVSTASTFAADKYAKFLEDEYDDSRFRDPEPPESPQNNKSNFSRDDFNRGGNFCNRQNFRADSGSYFVKDKFEEPNKRDFGDSRNTRSGFNDRRDGRAPFSTERNRDGSSFGSFNRDSRFGNRNQFGKSGPNERDGPNRSGFNKRPGPEADISSTKPDITDKESKVTHDRPVSLLDLPLMKPPDLFDAKKPFSDKTSVPFSSDAAIASYPDDSLKTFPSSNTRFTDVGNESKDKDSLRASVNKISPLHVSNSLPSRDLPVNIEKQEPVVVEPFTPSKIFEYDHISRSNDDVGKAFEPIYVFDYSHGKKKSTDYLSSMLKPEIMTSLPPLKPEISAADEIPWEGAEPWDEGEKIKESAPMPPRVSNFGSESIKKSAFNSFKDVDLRENQNNIDASSFFKEKNEDEERWSRDSAKKKEVTLIEKEKKPATKLIDDLLFLPGRAARPMKLVIIMRGPPGSGKTFTAKLIKDKEVEMGGSAPRILSIDDYFTVEDGDETDINSKNKITEQTARYEYDATLEPSYHESLIKSFKKTISDGFFPFIIVDCVNEKLKKYDEMYSFAMLKGFQVYICEMDRDLELCIKHNSHNRSEEDISKIIAEWEPTPSTQIMVDVRSLLQSVAVPEVQMTEVSEDSDKSEEVKENTELKEDETKLEKEEPNQKVENNAKETENVETNVEGYSSYMEVLCASKWEKMEQTEEKLDRLDGVIKRKVSTSFKDWLQLPDEGDLSWYTADGTSDNAVPKKKRVRWADLEERVAQQKMRAMGFVVGHTDWNRMMDPSFGGDKLTQTKYIYK